MSECNCKPDYKCVYCRMSKGEELYEALGAWPLIIAAVLGMTLAAAIFDELKRAGVL